MNNGMRGCLIINSLQMFYFVFLQLFFHRVLSRNGPNNNKKFMFLMIMLVVSQALSPSLVSLMSPRKQFLRLFQLFWYYSNALQDYNRFRIMRGLPHRTKSSSFLQMLAPVYTFDGHGLTTSRAAQWIYIEPEMKNWCGVKKMLRQ